MSTDFLRLPRGSDEMPSFRFRPGKDDELRKWYKSLPPGERSREIRRILKEHIGGSQSHAREDKPKRKITPGERRDKDNGNAEKKVDDLMKQF